MQEYITVGDTLEISLPVATGTLGNVTLTFPSPVGAVLGDVGDDALVDGVLCSIRTFPDAADLAVGSYVLPMTFTLNGGTTTTELDLGVRAATAPALPAGLLPVAAWRNKLRVVLQDKVQTDPLDDTQTLAPVLSDDDLNDSLYEALRVVSVYRPVEKSLPDLVLQAGVGTYVLPADFMAPETRSWKQILSSPWASGAYWGSRYGWMRYQAALSAPVPRGNNPALAGSGVGLGFGGVSSSGLVPLAYDADGNALAFTLPNLGREGMFEGPTAARPSPTFVLNPAPGGASTYSGLRYIAAHGVVRLTPSGDGWASGDDGYTVTPIADGETIEDATDVLSFTASDDLVRLTLLYAKHWALNALVLDAADSDGETYSFYSTKTGMARGDIQKQADGALKEFERRTRLRAYGVTG